MKKILLIISIVLLHLASIAQPFSPTFSGYTPDGLFSPNARPIVFWNPNSDSRTLVGYEDYGSGQYVPRVGFLQTVSPYMPAAKNSIGNILNGSLTFNVGLNNEERIRIAPNGNVGIGTVNPQARFQINPVTPIAYNEPVHYQPTTAAILSPVISAPNASSPNYSSILQLVAVREALVNGRYANGYLGFSTVDNSNLTGIMDAGRIAIVNDDGISTVSPTSLSFWTNTGGSATNPATERMRINSAGNIGLGTPNPTATLEVVRGSGSGGTAVFRGTDRFSHFNYSTGEDTYIRGGKLNSNVYLNDNGGNVGIGTSTTDAKLTVNGKIHAGEVKVDLSVPGPDYVFEKEYALKSLPETEKFIAENKHLPEIPSAKEMKEKGLDVGEMQMKLLQKIEELTIYLIEKDKELAVQKTLYKNQQGQIDSLISELKEIKKEQKNERTVMR